MRHSITYVFVTNTQQIQACLQPVRTCRNHACHLQLQLHGMQLLTLVNNGHVVTCVCMRQHLHTWVFTSMLLSQSCRSYGSHEHAHCVKAVVSIELIEMLRTDCRGELALRIPSSSRAGKRKDHFHYHKHHGDIVVRKVISSAQISH